MTAPWWEVLGIERSEAASLHRLSMTDAVARVQRAFILQLKRDSVRSVRGELFCSPGEFDDLVNAVHAAWLELGVSR